MQHPRPTLGRTDRPTRMRDGPVITGPRSHRPRGPHA